MNLNEYYSVLGLPVHSSVEEIKKAYRKKARIYHPDINHAPDAVTRFITITEAYEFLISNHDKIKTDQQAYDEAMEEWRKYRQDRARRRARAYARTSYNTFKSTRFYKSTRIMDGTTIIFSFVISIIVIVFSIVGYIIRLRHPVPGLEKPSVFSFIMLLLPGLVFFVVALIFLLAYIETSKKHRKKF